MIIVTDRTVLDDQLQDTDHVYITVDTVKEYIGYFEEARLEANKRLSRAKARPPVNLFKA